MNAPITVNRRDFLKVSAVATAGLVVGCYLPPEERLETSKTATAETFTPNAFIQIATDNSVTIMVAKVEMGQGVRTSLPMIVAEELEADWSAIRIEQAPGHSAKFANQGTGGSSSVRTSWTPLRKAGAAAREMLMAAAAQKWGVEAATCRAEHGTVVHPPTGRKANYGELASAASKLPVPNDPKLKDPKDFRIIGTRARRLDNPQILNGTAGYGLDVKVPGMLIATVARCPVFGGKVAGFDATKTKAIPGVRHVVQISNGIAVVADGFWPALQGRRALDITWDEGPNAALNSAAIRKMMEENSQKPGAQARNDGDAQGALKSAAKTIEAVFEVPFLAHATMEPMNCTADVRQDRCEIWAPTQTPGRVLSSVAEFTKLPQEAIQVHVTLLGGGFGRRLEADFAVEAVETSKAVGKPVKVVWTREDDMQHDFYRPASYHRLSAGLDDKGNLTAWIHRMASPSIGGQRGRIGPEKKGLDDSAVRGIANTHYNLPNLLVEYAMTNTAVPAGPWRSVYDSQNGFVQESFMDEVAASAGKDPYQFRRGLLGKAPRLLGVLDLVAAKAGWGKPLPEGRHQGISCHESFGSFVAEVAEVSVTREGTVQVHRVVCAVDCGLVVNPDMAEAQAQGAIVNGLTAALKGEITIEGGRVVQSNFNDFDMLRMEETPVIEVHFVPSAEPPGGIGEPPLPPIAAALANAIFAATGKRVRRLPIKPADIKS